MPLSERLFLIATLLLTAAKPQTRSCEATYKRALALAREGELVKAQTALQSCALTACSRSVRQQCTARYEQVLADTPSIVPTVTDEDGAPIVDVEVKMDGNLLVSQIDGRAVSIDPGLHEFSFVRGDTIVAKQKVVILQGQRNHPIAIKLQRPVVSAAPPLVTRPAVAPEPQPQVPAAALSELPAPEPKRRSAGGAYVLMGTGLLALGGFGALTYWGQKDNEKLALCTPNCSPASIDHIRDLYQGANIALTAGIVGVVTGGWWWLHSRYSVSVQPGTAGASASIGGFF